MKIRDCEVADRFALLALCILVGSVSACARAPDQDETPGPEASAAALAVAAWAARVDADTARVAPVRCNLSPEVAQGAVVFVHRPDDSSTRLVADFQGPGGRAIENYYAKSDTVRLFVRVDEWYGNPARGAPGRRITDSTWFADGAVTRWVDTLGRSRPTIRKLVGARAENIQGFYNDWRRAVRECR